MAALCEAGPGVPGVPRGPEIGRRTESDINFLLVCWFGVVLTIPRFSDIYRRLTRRLLRAAVRQGDDNFVHQLLNIILKRERGCAEDDDLIVRNHALPTNSSTVSHYTYIYIFSIFVESAK